MMSIDKSLQKLQEMQEYIQRITDPVGDALKRANLLGDQYNLGILAGPSSAMEVFREAEKASNYVSELTAMQKNLGFSADLSRAIETYRETTKDLGLMREVAVISSSAYDEMTIFSNDARLIAGPMDEARRALSALEKTDEFTNAFTALQTFENNFRLPQHNEFLKIAAQAEEVASRMRDSLHISGSAKIIQDALARMHTPWLDDDNIAISAKSFATIQTLGQGLKSLAPYDDNLTLVLRDLLGDWRNVEVFPVTIIEPVARSRFYVEHGFDPGLTDFPAAAFDEMTTAAGIVLSRKEGDKDGAELRSVRAFQRLSNFERRLRTFINRVMTEAFGTGWMKHQLPNNMLQNWMSKRDAALKNGGSESVLIDYADFTDYVRIVSRRDNWEKAFAIYFGGRVESVHESFLRISPVRITTMHSRIITLDDEIFLDVEIKRLLHAVSKTEQ
jgi:hypothetical protein